MTADRAIASSDPTDSAIAEAFAEAFDAERAAVPLPSPATLLMLERADLLPIPNPPVAWAVPDPGGEDSNRLLAAPGAMADVLVRVRS